MPVCSTCGKITIYDGPNGNSTLILTHIGSPLPEDIISGGNTVLVKNDASYLSYSFVLQYTVVEGTSGCYVTLAMCVTIYYTYP